MMEFIPCYGALAAHWGLLPATRLASREMLIEQNIKKRTGPALCVLCGPDIKSSNPNDLKMGQHSSSVYNPRFLHLRRPRIENQEK
jgi:hypothetical protein